MQRQRVLLSYQDYAELPDDGRRYELHEGELSVTPAPGTEHQRTSRKLLVLVNKHVESRGLGEVFVAPFDCILDDHTIVQPDLVFIDPSRAAYLSSRGVDGPPSLVAEIISSNTARIDRVRKLQLYARYAVPYYWIVDPEARAVEAYQLVNGQYELVARATISEPASLPPFPGLVIAPASIWG